MSGLAYLLWYFPIALLAPLILQACKHDDVKTIVRRAGKDFLWLTGIFLVGGLILFFLHGL